MSRRIAGDGFFLLSLLEGDGLAEELLFTLRWKGYTPAISWSAGRELMFAAWRGDAAARHALDMTSPKPDGSKILCCPLDRDLEMRAKDAARALVDAGLIDNPNLALHLADCAAMGAVAVILPKEDLRGLRVGEIIQVFRDNQLGTPRMEDAQTLLRSIS